MSSRAFISFGDNIYIVDMVQLNKSLLSCFRIVYYNVRVIDVYIMTSLSAVSTLCSLSWRFSATTSLACIRAWSPVSSSMPTSSIRDTGEHALLNSVTSWILLLYVMFWQNQCCCEHLHDHQCGHWEIPGGLPASSLQTGSDPDLQVSPFSISCMFIWIEKLYKRPSVKIIFGSDRSPRC